MITVITASSKIHGAAGGHMRKDGTGGILVLIPKIVNMITKRNYGIISKTANYISTMMKPTR